MALVLLIVMLLMLMVAFPRWSHSRDWGYAPASLIGIVLVIVVVFAVAGSIPWYGWSRGPVVIDQRPVIIQRPVVVQPRVVNPQVVDPTPPPQKNPTD